MGKTVCAILLAAGSSTRMGRDEHGLPVNKLLLEFTGGLDPIKLCVIGFAPYVDEMVLAVSPATEASARAACSLLSIPYRIVYGGSRRQDSVTNALAQTQADVVAIHDCARCLVTSEVIINSIAKAKELGSGAAAIKVRDTLRDVAGETVDRSELYAMQTPQSFDRKRLVKAYEDFNDDVTDDASVWQMAYGSIEYSKGDIMNQKLTEYSDLKLFASCINTPSLPRFGYGEDTHRLVEGRKLILGGVEIPFELGLYGHSDADALTHAVIDALLGAAALGDIGRHFPDSDDKYKGICSLELLKKTSLLLREKGWTVCNIDATIIAQKPKLAPYIDKMRANIAESIGTVDLDAVSVKATTPEGIGPEGNLECITVRAVASLACFG